MVNIQKTWQDAQSYCRSLYTDLARIRSPWEQSQVNAVVGRWVSAWIGLFLDSWQWADQWSRRFRNWASGPPSVVTAGCAAVVTGTSGRWTDDICTTPHLFVCYGGESQRPFRSEHGLKTGTDRSLYVCFFLYRCGQDE